MFGVSALCEGAVLINWALCGGAGGGAPWAGSLFTVGHQWVHL